MELAYKKLGEGTPFIILHGLYGSSDNWYTIGKKLSTSYTVYLIDQRNHGQSPHHPVHTYPALQEDLYEFFNRLNISKVVLMGHSMGGKCAMLFALLHPELIKELIIVDVAPRDYKNLTEYSSHAIEHLNIIQALHQIDLNQCKTRIEVEKQLALYIQNSTLRQFLLKNLKIQNNLFSWKINVEALSQNLPGIVSNIDISKIIIDKEKMKFSVLFVKGERSDYIRESDQNAIKQLFPKAQFTTIFDAGHWLHAEQPAAFIKTLLYFLENE